MAARQGLSAHISQASEDAKRAVLQRTSLHNSLWFSNLNTTCTIKSAPPRTPDVLGLLGTKSGWLLKRNEQHVWQARWCCVVPHTFLYYFDAHPVGADSSQAPQLTAKQQEILNAAVKEGYGKRGAAKQHQPRSSLYHVLGTGAGPSSGPPSEIDQDGHANHSLQPAGIIDLECYTTVHRNSRNQYLMELAGDESVNPDLRSFYFCASTEGESEEWTQALLSQRHGSLVDEKEAYRQVCDGFAQQLQDMHTSLENAQRTIDNQQDELYRVRSSMEDTRRNCWRLVQDTLERSDGTVPAKKAYRTDLESIQAQDLGLLSGVQLLCDYTRVLEEMCGDCGGKIARLEGQLAQKREGDQSKVNELQTEIDRMREQMEQQQETYHEQMEKMQMSLLQSQKECQDVQKDLASQRMEMTMYQSATRTKIGELQSHKKILKKEVIELRQKLEEVHSELDLQKHKQSSSKLEVEQERQKAKLLERYVEQMIENQAKVQQGMMELMSSAGSQYGGASHFASDRSFNLEVPGSPGVKSVDVSRFSARSRDFLAPTPAKFDHSPEKYDNIIENTPSSVRQEEQVNGDTGDFNDNVGDLTSSNQAVSSATAKNQENRIEDDNKSHMSELTEDRTQKQFDAAFMYSHPSLQSRHPAASPRAYSQQGNMGPPSIIGVTDETTEDSDTPKKLDTIMSTHSALNQRSVSRNHSDLRRQELAPSRPTGTTPRGGDASSVSTFGSSQKLSVAQRARLEADQAALPIRVRVNGTTTPLRGNSSGLSPMNSSSDSLRRNRQQHTTKPQVIRTASSNSNGSFFSSLGKRIEAVLDSSPIGVDIDGSDEESCESSQLFNSNDTDKRRNSDQHQEEKKTSDAGSIASTNVSLSLAERQQLQRAQQVKFLKNQGLIRDESQVRGGAGASSPSRTVDGGSSVGSFSAFGR